MRSFALAAGLALTGLAFAGLGQAQAHDPPGRFRYYGNGPHDLMPHRHSVSPWGGVRSYSYTPFGLTKSYNGFPGYSPYPGGYYGGYGWYGRYQSWGW
jgi:hypothetical protein